MSRSRIEQALTGATIIHFFLAVFRPSSTPDIRLKRLEEALVSFDSQWGRGLG